MANVFVFIPAYRGQVSTIALESSHMLASTLMSKGILPTIGTYSWYDIAELRNMVLSVWYDTMPTSTHLLFVDDDMGFLPQQVVDMMAFGEPVVGAIYPAKGLPREWVGSGIEGAEYRPGFIECEGTGGGLLLIQREAVTKMIEAYPDQVGQYMVIGDFAATGAKRTLRFFDNIYSEKGKVSEDISFCRRWREAGGRVWASVGYEMQHVGPFVFSGCFAKERDEAAAKKQAAG